MSGWVIIKSIGESGVVTEIELGGIGGWKTNQSNSGVTTESARSGTGLTIDIVMVQNHALTLNDIASPKIGDSAMVLKDELNNNLRFHWMYADMNGDGIANWVPAGQAESESIPDDNVYITTEENIRTIAASKKTLIDNAEQKTNKVNTITGLNLNTKISKKDTETNYPSESAVFNYSVSGVSTGDNNGQISYTKSGTTSSVSVKGLESPSTPNLVFASATSVSTKDPDGDLVASYPSMRNLVVEDLPIGTYFGKTGTFTASSWTTSSPYVCTTSVTGIDSTDIAIVDLVPSSSSTTRQSQITEFSKVNMVETNNGSITLTCDSSYPNIDLDIKIFSFKSKIKPKNKIKNKRAFMSIGIIMRKSETNNHIYGISEGGLGRTSYSSGYMLISDGSNMISQRYIRNNTSATYLSSSYNYIPTSSTIYYGLPSFNNSRTYTSSTSLYMPTDNPKAYGYILMSNGSGAPFWINPHNSNYGSDLSFTWASNASAIGPGFKAFRFQNFVIFNIGFRFSSTYFNAGDEPLVGTISPAPPYEHMGLAVQDESKGAHNWYRIISSGGLSIHFLEYVNSNVYFYISGAYAIY
ncbi:MAG: hypothetical protein NkDv07_0598 [Candidatus Improbicoccus devescovinae]|nr:MAG: hypothetical protein NkDv07_0598 [Candidatus Improbicoccus devescovinae]